MRRVALFGLAVLAAASVLASPGPGVTRADLFPQFFTYDDSNLTLTDNRGLISQAASGSNGFAFSTNGARGDFGTGPNDSVESDGEHITIGPTAAGYIASGTPHALTAVYTNLRLMAGTIYGGGVLPARPFTIQAIRFRIRQVGTIGTTNVVWQIAGTGNCDCSFACNSAVGNYRVACSGSCAFPASDNLTYQVTSIGDCAAGPDLIGNVAVEGIWQ